MQGVSVRRVGVVVAVSLLAACRSSPEHERSGHTSDAQIPAAERWCVQETSSGACTIFGPSLITLIARPEDFDGKRVRVIGYVHFEFEGNGLYVSQDDYEHAITRNGVWIDPPLGFESDSGPTRAQRNDRYVIVEGTFSDRDRGHMGMWSGAIEHVERLEAWSATSAPPRAGFRDAAP